MSLLRKALLYWQTLRYLKASQIYHRICYRLSKAQPSLARAPYVRERSDAWIAPVAKRACMVGPSEFILLGVRGTLTGHGWNDSSQDKLWRYNLHYFDDLNAVNASERRQWHAELLGNWCANNPVGCGVGWEPYPTSLRVVNWIKWSLAGNSLTDECLHSLAIQVRWLSARLERHLLGNHYFANAKALVMAGLFFSGEEADNWLRLGLHIVAAELPEQVLADGGNFERSPMYHAIFLEDMLDLVNAGVAWSGRIDIEVISDWRRISKRMLDWLLTMSHPDGDISFFNDAAFGVAPLPAHLLSYAEALGVMQLREVELRNVRIELVDTGCRYLEESGYIRVENDHMVALLDVAPIGPDYLPGHAHADTLSFELSLFGQRVFVNSGTSIYGLSMERERQRGTAAHNTVVVDGVNSSVVWGGFRVAERARVLDVTLQQSAQGACITASHDGYTRLGKRAIHSRSWLPSKQSLTIRDRISGSFYTAQAIFHLHPSISVQPLASNHLSLVLPSGHRLSFLSHLDSAVLLQDSTWHPHFGCSMASKKLIVSSRSGSIDVALDWANAGYRS